MLPFPRVIAWPRARPRAPESPGHLWLTPFGKLKGLLAAPGHALAIAEHYTPVEMRARMSLVGCLAKPRKRVLVALGHTLANAVHEAQVALRWSTAFRYHTRAYL